MINFCSSYYFQMGASEICWQNWNGNLCGNAFWKQRVINMLYIAKYLLLGPLSKKWQEKKIHETPFQASLHEIFLSSPITLFEILKFPIRISNSEPHILVKFTLGLIPVFLLPLAMIFLQVEIDASITWRKYQKTLLCLYPFNYLLYCHCY